MTTRGIDRLSPRVPVFAMIAVAFLLVETNLTTYNLQGPATLGLAVVGLLVLPIELGRGMATSDHMEPRNPRRGSMSAWMVAFVGWSGLLLLLHPSEQGLQNWLVWMLLPLTAVLVASQTTAGTARIIHRWWRLAATVSALGYLYLVITHQPGYADGFYAARPAGWTAATAAALIVPWSALNRTARWPSLLLVVAAGASLTRTATAVAGIMLVGLAARQLRSGRVRGSAGWFRLAGLATLVGVGLYEAMTRIGPLRDRFLTGDQAFNYGGVNLNTSGREQLWTATRQAIPEHWWIGHGPGQCQLFIKARFVTIEHPHNEYLRLLYDTGVIGLALWSLGLLSLIVAAWRRYRVADRNEDRAVHVAAILSVLVLLLGAITDNLSVTLPTALAIGTLVGMSMGRANVPPSTEDDVAEASEEVSLVDR